MKKFNFYKQKLISCSNKKNSMIAEVKITNKTKINQLLLKNLKINIKFKLSNNCMKLVY